MIKTIVFDFGNVIGFFSHRLASGRLSYLAGVTPEAMHAYLFGGGLEEDAGAFLEAWRRAERGERVDETVLAFESWEALAAVMTCSR